MKKKSLYQSFRRAISGIKETRGVNFKIMVGVALITVIASFVLRIPIVERLIILTIVGLVLSIEIINTALERYIDSQNPGVNKDVKLLKDMLAGAVLVSCIVSVIIGGIIFLSTIVK